MRCHRSEIPRWILVLHTRSRGRGCGESQGMATRETPQIDPLLGPSSGSSPQPAAEPSAAPPLWARSAAALLADLAAGAISAAEAVEAHVARIEEVDGELRAVVWKRYAAARAEAAEADRRRAAGEPLGALHGLPITIKECFD